MYKRQLIASPRSSIKFTKEERVNYSASTIDKKSTNKKMNFQQFRQFNHINCLVQMMQSSISSFESKIQEQINKLKIEPINSYSNFQKSNPSLKRQQSLKSNTTVNPYNEMNNRQNQKQSQQAKNTFSQIRQKICQLQRNFQQLKDQKSAQTDKHKNQFDRVTREMEQLKKFNSNIQQLINKNQELQIKIYELNNQNQKLREQNQNTIGQLRFEKNRYNQLQNQLKYSISQMQRALALKTFYQNQLKNKELEINYLQNEQQKILSRSVTGQSSMELQTRLNKLQDQNIMLKETMENQKRTLQKTMENQKKMLKESMENQKKMLKESMENQKRLLKETMEIQKRTLQETMENQKRKLNETMESQKRLLKDTMESQKKMFKQTMESQKSMLKDGINEQKMRNLRNQDRVRVLQPQIKRPSEYINYREDQQKKKQHVENINQSMIKQVLDQSRLHAFFNNNILHSEYVMKPFIIESLEKRVGKTAKNAILLYKFDKLNKQNFHQYIDGYQNLLLILKTQEGRYLAAFTQDMLKPNHIVKKKGLLMSLSPKKGESKCFFQVANNNKYKSVQYSPFYVQFGNNEIRIRTNYDRVQSKVGSYVPSMRYFDTKQETAKSLFGITNSSQGTIIQTYEFYRMVFQQ